MAIQKRLHDLLSFRFCRLLLPGDEECSRYDVGRDPFPEQRCIRAGRSLANRIALAGEVAMLDGSPMFVRAIEGNNSADYLPSGSMYSRRR